MTACQAFGTGPASSPWKTDLQSVRNIGISPALQSLPPGYELCNGVLCWVRSTRPGPREVTMLRLLNVPPALLSERTDVYLLGAIF